MIVRIANSGAADAPAGVVATFYDGVPATNTIIGTVPISKVLRPGEYEDIAYSMSNPGPGVHQLYAAVDSANAVSECRKDDNQIRLDFTVQSTYPDLKIGFEDISLPTGTAYEGNLVPITVLVRNIGATSASNVAVRMYNGSPIAGGMPVGTEQVISAISSSGTATLSFTYDTLGHDGTNILYFVADPANTISETNEANNTASASLTVQPPALPNLVVTSNDILIAPANPREGEQVTITATVLNRGTAVGNVPVQISVRGQEPGASGQVLGTKTIYPILGLGQSASVTATVDTAGMVGQQSIVVTIDPENMITESDKTDNSAPKTDLYPVSRAHVVRSSRQGRVSGEREHDRNNHPGECRYRYPVPGPVRNGQGQLREPDRHSLIGRRRDPRPERHHDAHPYLEHWEEPRGELHGNHGTRRGKPGRIEKQRSFQHHG